MNMNPPRCLWFMVFNTTFQQYFVITWRSVLLVEKTGVPGVTDNFYHKMLQEESPLNSH